MKLSTILAIMGFLVTGLALVFLIMTIFSNDSNSGLAIISCVLIIMNGLIAVGVSDLLTKHEGSHEK